MSSYFTIYIIKTVIRVMDDTRFIKSTSKNKVQKENCFMEMHLSVMRVVLSARLPLLLLWTSQTTADMSLEDAPYLCVRSSILNGTSCQV
jgi:hypothetical protein